MSDPILRETLGVVLREFQCTTEFLKALNGGLFDKTEVKKRIKNRVGDLEKSAQEIEIILGGK